MTRGVRGAEPVAVNVMDYYGQRNLCADCDGTFKQHRSYPFLFFFFFFHFFFQFSSFFSPLFFFEEKGGWGRMVREAELQKAEVVALRLYTSVSARSIAFARDRRTLCTGKADVWI